MRRFLLVLVLFSLTLTSVAIAQQQPRARDPQAMVVLRTTLAAMGGAGAASIQDTVVQATLTPPQGQAEGPGTVTFKTKGLDKIRSDASSGSKSASSIFNNGREFRSSDRGMQPSHSANADHKRIEHLPALMLAQELDRADFSAAYVGQESFEGRSVQHVRLFRISNRAADVDPTFTKNSELNVYVDTQTSQIVKIAFPYVSENDWRQSLPMEIYYGDYRVVNGIAIPFHQRYFFNGQPAGELQFTSVAVNQGTPDSVFDGRRQ